MAVKIGKYMFPKAVICHSREVRLSSMRVLENDMVPVVSMDKKWALCRLPQGYVGQQVGVIDTAGTSVFASLGEGRARLLFHIFDPFAPLAEAKHKDRSLAFVFGENPHAQNTKTAEEFGFDELNDSYFSLEPASLRHIDIGAGVFQFGFKIRAGILVGQIANPALKKSFENIRAMKAEANELSSVILKFSFLGDFIGSSWIIRAQGGETPWNTQHFPFVWDKLVEVPD